jgi:hypothetical protein
MSLAMRTAASVIVVGVLLSAVTVGMGPVRADPPSVVGVVAAHATVRAVAIDADVARANGYDVVTLADGSTASIARAGLRALGAAPSDDAIRASASSIVPGTASRGDIELVNTVYGDCGDSSYYLSIYGDGSWSSITGYNVRAAVVTKSWHTFLEDPSGSQIEGQEYDGGSTGPSWEGADSGPPFLTARGDYLGGVDAGAGQLVDGTSCFSGNPADVATF